MKTFRINRKKWLRGDQIHAQLWDSTQNKGCCLGHVIKQTTNCSWANLDGKTCPEHYYTKNSLLTEIRLDEGCHDNYLTKEAMNINDNPDITDNDREGALIKLFSKHGYNLEFYN